MAQDPRTSTQAYLEQHQLDELLQVLLAELLIQKPADPKAWCVAQLEKIKVAGTKPLLDAADLTAAFGMFDVTKKGTVTESQAVGLLRTMLAQDRAPAPGPAAATTAMALPEFLAFMQTALVAATPLCSAREDVSAD